MLSSSSVTAARLPHPLTGGRIRSLRGGVCWTLVLIAALSATGAPAHAGEVVLVNGDRITGKVRSLVDGKLTLESEAAGGITIDVKKVKTFSSDELIRLQVGKGAPFEARVAAGADGKVEVRRTPNATPEIVSIVDIVAINPSMPSWTGKVGFNGKITGGDSKTTEGGLDLELEKEWKDDRLRFTGEYMYGRERNRDTGESSTTDDFGNIYGKYEHDLHEKLYVDVNAKALHDELAELRYRVSPATGIGYRWFDAEDLELFTDIGIAYTDERFTSFGGRSFWGPQLEYGVEWKPADRWKLSHTLEYYPSFSDFTGNFLIDIKAGGRVTMWRHTFVEINGEYHHDTEPAASAKKGEYRFTLGPGWAF